MSVVVCLPFCASEAQVLYYNFQFNDPNTATTTAANSGAAAQSGTFLNSANSPAALQTATGVSGAPGDYAFNNSASTMAGAGGKVSIANFGTGLPANMTSFTLAMWYNPSSGLTNAARLFSNSNLELLDVTNPGQFALNVDSGQAQISSGNASKYNTLNAWTFMAVTVDLSLSSNQVNFYVGSTSASVSLVQTVSLTGTVPVSLTLAAGNTSVLGNSVLSPRAFEGLMDDFSFYAAATGSAGALNMSSLESIRLSAVPEPTAAQMVILSCAAMVLIGVLKRPARSVA